MANPKDSDSIKTAFLYAAIADAQGTIRATDAKISVLMVILAIPFTKLGSIYRDCFGLYSNQNRYISNIALIFEVAFLLFWILSFWAATRAINPVDDPSEHIDGGKPTGVFYSGGLFQPGFWAANFKCFTK